MPLTLHVGLSKKAGLPNYGSIGASCQVEVELENSLLHQDLDTFQQHVRKAYVACAQAVNDELARHLGPACNQERNGHSAGWFGQPPSASAPNDASHTHEVAAKVQLASPRQLDYAEQLAGQIPGLGIERLEVLAQVMFEMPLADLSRHGASELIDVLKDLKAGRLALESVFHGEAA